MIRRSIRDFTPASARRTARVGIVGLLSAIVADCGERVDAHADLSAGQASRSSVVSLDHGGSLRPVTPFLDVDRDRADLGRRLFHEPLLSHDGSLSCASCHPLARGGADGLARSQGINGQLEDRNTPTVFNAAMNFRQFWDGRAATLEAQTDSPLTSSAEMASTWPEILRKLDTSPSYRKAFDARYPDGLTARNVRDAIATFERTLIVTGSPFDRFLIGDEASLSASERRGYSLFRSVGCVSCHQGANVGGNLYERLGVIESYFGREGRAAELDVGRMAITSREEDRFVFRVPSLRFAVKTAPYLHDGSIATLDQTIRLMATYQLGRRLSQDDVDDIAHFLGTLAGPTPE